MKYSLSVVVSCLDEEAHVKDTVDGLIHMIGEMPDRIGDYEIVIVNDGSTDQTGSIADALATANPRVKVVHNPQNMGLGYSYRRGVEAATEDYVMLVPGDNELKPISVKMICEHIGEADVILPYPANPEIRPLYRRWVSSAFTKLLNLITGHRIKYYNGQALQRRSDLLKIDFKTHGLAYQAAILLQMLRLGYSIKEVPCLLNYSSHRSRVFGFKSVVSVCKALIEIFIDERIKPKVLSKPAFSRGDGK